MKKLILVLLTALMLSGCADSMEHGGKEYPTYGIFNYQANKSEDMCYEVSIGNIIWSVLLVETIVVPVYMVGFSIMEPSGPSKDGKCGIDADTS